MNEQPKGTILSGYHILDLADEKGMLCSRLLDSPQLKERAFFIEVEHPESGKRHKFPGALCQLSRSPWRAGTYVPAPGEHNMEVYHGEPGLSEKDIEAVIQEGVFQLLLRGKGQEIV